LSAGAGRVVWHFRTWTEFASQFWAVKTLEAFGTDPIIAME